MIGRHQCVFSACSIWLHILRQDLSGKNPACMFYLFADRIAISGHSLLVPDPLHVVFSPRVASFVLGCTSGQLFSVKSYPLWIIEKVLCPHWLGLIFSLWRFFFCNLIENRFRMRIILTSENVMVSTPKLLPVFSPPERIDGECKQRQQQNKGLVCGLLPKVENGSSLYFKTYWIWNGNQTNTRLMARIIIQE